MIHAAQVAMIGLGSVLQVAVLAAAPVPIGKTSGHRTSVTIEGERP